MSFAKVSVLKKIDNAGRPVAFRDRVVLIDTEDLDIDQYPARDANGVKIVGDIVLKAGCTAFEIYATPKTLKSYDTSSGDPDKKGFIHHLELEHPGDELEYAEFVENCINKNFVAITSKWDGTKKRVIGEPGCPIQLTHEGKNDSEAITNTIKFESFLPGPKIGHYEGAIPALDTAGSGSGA
jgi:hypothetical protein